MVNNTTSNTSLPRGRETRRTSVTRPDTRPKLPVKPKGVMGSTNQSPMHSVTKSSSYYNDSYRCRQDNRRPVSIEGESFDLFRKKQQMPPDSLSETSVETTMISRASLVLSHLPNDVETGHNCSHFVRTDSSDSPLSDYENSSPTTPPQGLLSKSSSTSSTSSFNNRPFTRAAHSLSTSLSSAQFPLFQPVDYQQNSTYLFHTSDCEDQSDYVPSNFSRSFHHNQNTPSPLISRPSSPLPPTPSPNFSRSPSPNWSSRRFQPSFSPGPSNPNSVPGSPQFTRSLNPSRESSPLRLRPSSYTRPLSPNPPTVSPGPSRGQSPRNLHSGLHHHSSSRLMRSQPSSPQSQPRSSSCHQSVNPVSAFHGYQTSNQHLCSPPSPLASRRNISLRSPPSPTRPVGPGLSRSPSRTPFNGQSPVTSRPPSPMNSSRQHSLLLPGVRPARSQSQPPGSHRLHSRASRSTRTPSPRPPRLPSSPHHPSHQPSPPPPPPTSPLPDSSRRSSRMRAR